MMNYIKAVLYTIWFFVSCTIVGWSIGIGFATYPNATWAFLGLFNFGLITYGIKEYLDSKDRLAQYKDNHDN